MTNKTETVCVPRDLLERLAYGEWECASLKDRDTLRALLAAPAEDIRAVVDESVATVVTIKKQSLPMLIAGKYQPSISSDEKVAMFDIDLPNGTKLYRHPQRPVASLKRYDWDRDGGMVEDATGEYVLWSEIEGLNK